MGNFSAVPSMFRGVVVPQGVVAGGGIALVSRWLFGYPNVETGIDGLILARSTYGAAHELQQETAANRPDVIDPHVEMGVPGITGDTDDYIDFAGSESLEYLFLYQTGEGGTVVLAFRRNTTSIIIRDLWRNASSSGPGLAVFISGDDLIVEYYGNGGSTEASVTLALPGENGSNLVAVVRWNGADEINIELDGIGGSISGSDNVPSPGTDSVGFFRVGHPTDSGLEWAYLAGLEIYNKDMGASFINTAKLQWANRGMDFNPWFLGATTADSGGVSVTSLAVDLPVVPGGILAGDLIVVCCSCGNDGGGSNLINTPAWSDGELLTDLLAGGAAPSSPTTTIFYEIAQGGESGIRTFTVDSIARLGAVCFVVRGINTGNVIDAATTTATGSSANPDPPSITTISARTMVIAFMHGDGAMGDGEITAVPSGYQQIAIQQRVGLVAAEVSVAIAYKILAAAGAENPGTFTRDTEQWGAATIALRVAT